MFDGAVHPFFSGKGVQIITDATVCNAEPRMKMYLLFLISPITEVNRKSPTYPSTEQPFHATHIRYCPVQYIKKYTYLP
jgi:hypothetical protein